MITIVEMERGKLKDNIVNKRLIRLIYMVLIYVEHSKWNLFLMLPLYLFGVYDLRQLDDIYLFWYQKCVLVGSLR